MKHNLIVACCIFASICFLSGCSLTDNSEQTTTDNNTTQMGWGTTNDTAVPENESGWGNASDSSQEDTTDRNDEPINQDLAPDFTATLADGSSFTLSEHRGSVILLNFWATWCGPCVGEMPAFEQLNNEYGDEVVILAVNCMEDENTVNQFIKYNGYTFPIAYDVNGAISDLYPTDGIPYTLVIGTDGTVLRTFIGADSADVQYREYKSAIDAALQQ